MRLLLKKVDLVNQSVFFKQRLETESEGGVTKAMLSPFACFHSNDLYFILMISCICGSG